MANHRHRLVYGEGPTCNMVADWPLDSYPATCSGSWGHIVLCENASSLSRLARSYHSGFDDCDEGWFQSLWRGRMRRRIMISIVTCGHLGCRAVRRGNPSIEMHRPSTELPVGDHCYRRVCCFVIVRSRTQAREVWWLRQAQLFFSTNRRQWIHGHRYGLVAAGVHGWSSAQWYPSSLFMQRCDAISISCAVLIYARVLEKHNLLSIKMDWHSYLWSRVMLSLRYRSCCRAAHPPNPWSMDTEATDPDTCSLVSPPWPLTIDARAMIMMWSLFPWYTDDMWVCEENMRGNVRRHKYMNKERYKN